MICRLLLLAALLLTACAAAGAAAEDDGALVAEGERIYREGVLPSGEPIEAVVRGDLPLTGPRFACVSCHRRSALGSSEGGVLVPPIAGPQLYQPRRAEMHDSYGRGGITINRPAYDLTSLAAALREGIDPAGRPLEPLMPRYRLGEHEVAALAAYLASLTGAPAPGVTDAEIHFATLIAPGTPPAREEALLQVLQRFFDDKNAGTRLEQRRQSSAVFHKRWEFGAYRHWVLHIWRLDGPPETWQPQLERHYAERPVFAVLGGVGDGDWQPVHHFCEAREIPCLFPHTPAPPQEADRDFYSIYLSRGLGLEADALAARLLGEPVPTGEVVQVYRDTPQGRLAAKRFRNALSKGGRSVVDKPVAGEADAAFWRELLARIHPATVVAWVTEDDLATLASVAPGGARLFVSATETPGFDSLQLGPWRERLFAVSPYAPLGARTTASRMQIWARQRGIPVTDLPLQADAYFTAAVAGSALAHIRGNFSREYFIERIEHMIDTMLDTSVYPRVSLAPDQRYLAKSCFIWRVSDGRSSAVTITP